MSARDSASCVVVTAPWSCRRCGEFIDGYCRLTADYSQFGDYLPQTKNWFQSPA